MQVIHTSINKQRIKRKGRDGIVTESDRYVLNYNDPATSNRTIRRFKTRKEAEAAQQDIIKNFELLAQRGKQKPPTLAEAAQYWLASKEKTAAAHTYKAYKQLVNEYFVGPAYPGPVTERRRYAVEGRKTKGLQFVPMLGKDTPIDEITTAQIRAWFLRVMGLSTPYVAKVAKKALSSMFRMIEEDFNLRLARMPSRPGPPYRRKQRLLLTEEQAKILLDAASRTRSGASITPFRL